MQLSRILREGFIAGLIGAGAVALWFLVVDVIAGRPFFTPAMLGSAVFWGVRDPALVVIEYSRIIGYTMIHVSAFIIVGTIAALGMGYYLWHVHPKIAASLKLHPLGETDEGE